MHSYGMPAHVYLSDGHRRTKSHSYRFDTTAIDAQMHFPRAKRMA
jgi:hypothetical protein